MQFSLNQNFELGSDSQMTTKVVYTFNVKKNGKLIITRSLNGKKLELLNVKGDTKLKKMVEEIAENLNGKSKDPESVIEGLKPALKWARNASVEGRTTKPKADEWPGKIIESASKKSSKKDEDDDSDEPKQSKKNDKKDKKSDKKDSKKDKKSGKSKFEEEIDAISLDDPDDDSEDDSDDEPKQKKGGKKNSKKPVVELDEDDDSDDDDSEDDSEEDDSDDDMDDDSDEYDDSEDDTDEDDSDDDSDDETDDDSDDLDEYMDDEDLGKPKQKKGGKKSDKKVVEAEIVEDEPKQNGKKGEILVKFVLDKRTKNFARFKAPEKSKIQGVIYLSKDYDSDTVRVTIG